MESVVFDSDDVDQIEKFVSKLYSRTRIAAVGTCTRARITRRVLAPELGFDDLDFSFDVTYSAEAQDRLIICDVVSNAVSTNGDGSEEKFGPGDQFLISRPGLRFSGIAHSPRLRFTLLDPTILTRLAGNGDAAAPVRVLDHHPTSLRAARYLQRSITYVRDNVMAAPDALRAPLLVATATQYVAASVLHTYPNTAVTATTIADEHHPHPGTVRRAVAYIDSHAHEPVGITDIAAHVFVTPRALQQAFRRHLNTTPTAYLRRVRLDHAHQDLVAANPSAGDTVAAVAIRWGFIHQGRFAAAYRTAYGNTPRETLHT